jgi:hypothetical protein
MGLTTYEMTGFGYILARANRKLNYRRVLGFKILGSNTLKRCEFRIVKRLKKKRRWDGLTNSYYIPHVELPCNRKAVIGVLYEIRDKKFMIYLCPRHFKEFLDNMVKYVRDRTERAYTLIMEKAYEVNPLIDVENVATFFQGDWE